MLGSLMCAHDQDVASPTQKMWLLWKMETIKMVELKSEL